MTDFTRRYGPAALVTGAGAGIGEAFADALAARGLDLVLVDVDARGLDRVAMRLSGRVDVRVVHADLATPEGIARVTAEIADPRVGLVVSNAGVSHLGHFVEIALTDHELALEVNVRATLHLVHAAGRHMRARKRGGIVLVSSNSGLLHSPYVAQYAGTKAYALALGEALFEELRPFDVDVLTVIPGLTRTAGLDKQGLDAGAAGGLLVAPSVVATRALDALGKKPRCFPNPRDRFGAAFMQMISPRAALALTARTMFRFFPTKLRPRLKG